VPTVRERRHGGDAYLGKLAMLPDLEEDPGRWFDCANEMRALAATIRDPTGRLLALLVAKGLHWFAEWLALQKGQLEKL
jgi:hypothetical protein